MGSPFPSAHCKRWAAEKGTRNLNCGTRGGASEPEASAPGPCWPGADASGSDRIDSIDHEKGQHHRPDRHGLFLVAPPDAERDLTPRLRLADQANGHLQV